MQVYDEAPVILHTIISTPQNTISSFFIQIQYQFLQQQQISQISNYK